MAIAVTPTASPTRRMLTASAPCSTRIRCATSAMRAAVPCSFTYTTYTYFRRSLFIVFRVVTRTFAHLSYVIARGGSKPSHVACAATVCASV